jgi:hypothetical protein
MVDNLCDLQLECFIVHDLTSGFEFNMEDQKWTVIILVFNFAIILTEALLDVPQFLLANADIPP